MVRSNNHKQRNTCRHQGLQNQQLENRRILKVKSELDTAIDNMAKEAIDQGESISLAPTWEDLLVIMLQMYGDTSYEAKIEFQSSIRLAGQVLDRLSGLINAMQPIIAIAQKSDLSEEDAKKIKKLDKKVRKIIKLVERSK